MRTFSLLSRTGLLAFFRPLLTGAELDLESFQHATELSSGGCAEHAAELACRGRDETYDLGPEGVEFRQGAERSYTVGGDDLSVDDGADAEDLGVDGRGRGRVLGETGGGRERSRLGRGGDLEVGRLVDGREEGGEVGW